MKIKKTLFSTMLSDLYGRDKYQPYIVVGREYWWCYPSDHEVSQLTHKNWNKIKVTYIRSRCMFYVLSDLEDSPEFFCSVDSFFASSLTLAEIDPIEDLGDTLGNIEAAKLKYCFDDEYTVVKNWPNEREIEIDEDEYYQKLDPEEYLYIKMLENKYEKSKCRRE